MAAMFGFSPILPPRLMTIFVFGGLLVGVAIAVVAFRSGQGGWRLRGETPASTPSNKAPVGNRTPDKCWKWGLFYYNPADPALWVEKRFGIGWTFNFGHPRAWFSDEQRRLLVACGAGAGMAAAYGVPLGGALFALEVLRGMLALRLVLPALLASLVATAISWLVLPDAPTYQIPAFSNSGGTLAWALIVGPIAGLVAVGYVRTVAWADRNKPEGWRRLAAPILALGLLGAISVKFPQVLGNGRDLSEVLFMGGITSSALLLLLLILKPAATVMCLGSGTPGGLFTPSLTFGALLEGMLGYVGLRIGSGVPLGLSAVLGAGALLAATTQGPISSVVLMMELTGRDRSFMAPLLLTVIAATLVSRMIEPRSIYDARLSDEEVKARLAAREPSPK
jgi:H+/Cl- antiporter ClcA